MSKATKQQIKSAGHVVMSEEKNFSSNLDDIIKWADHITGEWDGNQSGSREDRSSQAQDIIETASELQKLIEGMAEL